MQVWSFQHGCEIEPNDSAAQAVTNGRFSFNEAHCGSHGLDSTSDPLLARDYFLFDIPPEVTSGNFQITLTTNGGAPYVQLQLRDDSHLTGAPITFDADSPYVIIWPVTGVVNRRFYAYVPYASPDPTKTYTLTVSLPFP